MVKTSNEIYENDKRILDLLSVEELLYSNFLKMQGRVSKIPISATLEFFAYSPETSFVATEEEWYSLGFNLKSSAEAIRYIDEKGKIHFFYDLSQIEIENSEFLPKRLNLTNENSRFVINYLKSQNSIPEGASNIFSMMSHTSDFTIDISDCFMQLNVSESEKDDFIKGYRNAFFIIIAGRLECNTVEPYKIPVNNSFIKKLESSDDKFIFLSYVAKSAKDAIEKIEYAVRLYEEIRREKKYEVYGMEESDVSTEDASSTGGISDNSTQGNTATGIDRSDDSL